ncbi:MAG TPA: caspase family protein [Thermoanaerobaculia bacterium]
MRRLVCLVLLAAAPTVGLTLAAEPKLRNTVVVPLRLPSNYQPAAVPARPIDEKLQVGLLLLPFDRQGANATWTAPTKWEGTTSLFEPIAAENILEVERVYVNAAEPVASTLPRIFRRVFPRMAILPNRHCPTCDLVFVVKTSSANIVDSQNEIAGVKVTVLMYAVARNGVTVASFSGEGAGMRTKRMYWSSYTMARAMGEPALERAMEQLFYRIALDSSLTSFAIEKTTERARPSDLQTSVGFDDTSSILPNGRLDAGEQARLRFTVRNVGAGPAFAVRLRLSMAMNTIGLPAEAEIGDISPGATKDVEVPISAGLEVDTLQQQVQVVTLEKRGYGGRPVILQLATERLKRPILEIADVRLDDRGGRARGDSDGRPSNGETIEVVILVRNTGLGEAVGAELTVSSTPGVEVVEPALTVGSIAVSAVKEVRTLLRFPITFSDSDFGLTVQAVEARGASVATTAREQRWAMQTKRPQVEIGFRLFDGNSPQSRGNRDGMANNGEVIEVSLTPSNRGTLAASGVRLAIASTVAGLGIKPSTLDIGELPPEAEGREHRVQLTLPRAVERDHVLQRLPINVIIAQANFPVSEQMIGLPFHEQRPALVAAVASQSPLVEGKTALFAVDIQNHGRLSAEDVKADVSTDNVAVELLNANGTPARVVRLDVGSIAAESSARIQLRAQIRRNIAVVAGSLKVLISQRDFPAVDTMAALTIAKEEPEIISAVPPLEAVPAAAQVAGVPATVSFQRYRDGSRLTEETVGLAFEVQSLTRLAALRLEQNQRAIELPQTPEIRTPGGYLWQYEPRVHLDYGPNEFAVVVVTSEGVRNSRSITLHRQKPQGKVWLAVVGVSDYRDQSITDLDYATDDAVAVHSYYRGLGVPTEQVIELLDENATLANIKRRLGTELVKHASNPDDTVLIFFAGHGVKEADSSSADADGYSKYLLPYDANPADLFGSALSMEELSRILQRLRSERVVLIVDSCFSGAAGGRTPFEPNRARGVKISEEFLTRIANTGKGRVILTASSSSEVAQESSAMRHGIFTYFLLQGLRGAADIDRDGRVDVDELYKFVSQKVIAATDGRQNPIRKSPNLSGMLVVGGRLQ